MKSYRNQFENFEILEIC